MPTPCTATVRPPTSLLPNICCRAARMPWKTPHAVTGEGSPLPPAAALTPHTWAVSTRMWSMSATVVPLSSAVMYRPPRLSTKQPNARSRASLLSRRGSPMMTALPPPRFRPAHAAL